MQEIAFPLQPRAIASTMRDDAVYQFSFQILEVMEKAKSDKGANTEIGLAIKLFKELLDSNEVDTGSKYKIINAFANTERSSGSDINYRLNKAFETMITFDKKGIYSAINNAFQQADKRYFTGAQIIYEKEEHFIYMLYQGWSGESSNNVEISRIREAAARDLYKYPDALDIYWSMFPYPPGTKYHNAAVKDDLRFGTQCNELYVPLRSLLEISGKAMIENAELREKVASWKEVASDPNQLKQYHNQYSLGDRKDTLASFLKRKNILEPNK